MSHFAVIVALEDVSDLESVMQPYHEYECTDILDEYVKFVEIPDDELEDAKKNFADREDCDDFETYMKDYCGYTLDDAGNNWGRWTNPDAKWDWWVIGGRWGGYFAQKGSDERVDVIRKGDIDIDRMEQDSLTESLPTYDKFHRIIDGNDFITWPDMRARHENIDEARSQYHGQPVMELLRMGIKGAGMMDFEDMMVDREQFIARTKLEAIVPYALLSNGQWSSRGDMGWFGTSSNDIVDWPEQFRKKFDELDDDTMLVLVDCHI